MIKKENKNTYEEKNSENNNCKYIHSGIVENIPNNFIYSRNMYELNQVLIKSKWGEYGLFQHNVNQCPYFPNNAAGNSGTNVAS